MLGCFCLKLKSAAKLNAREQADMTTKNSLHQQAEEDQQDKEDGDGGDDFNVDVYVDEDEEDEGGASPPTSSKTKSRRFSSKFVNGKRDSQRSRSRSNTLDYYAMDEEDLILEIGRRYQVAVKTRQDLGLPS